MMFDEMLHSTISVNFQECQQQKHSLRSQIATTLRFTSPLMAMIKIAMIVAVIHLMHSNLYTANYYRTAFNAELNQLIPAADEATNPWKQIAGAGNNV